MSILKKCFAELKGGFSTFIYYADVASDLASIYLAYQYSTAVASLLIAFLILRIFVQFAFMKRKKADKTPLAYLGFCDLYELSINALPTKPEVENFNYKSNEDFLQNISASEGAEAYLESAFSIVIQMAF